MSMESPKDYLKPEEQVAEELKKEQEPKYNIPPQEHKVPTDDIEKLFEGALEEIKDPQLREEAEQYRRALLEYNNELNAEADEEKLQALRLKMRDLYKKLGEEGKDEQGAKALRSAIFYLGQKDRTLNPVFEEVGEKSEEVEEDHY